MVTAFFMATIYLLVHNGGVETLHPKYFVAFSLSSLCQTRQILWKQVSWVELLLTMFVAF